MNNFKANIEKLQRQYSAGILTMESFIGKEIELYLAEGKLEDIYQKYYSKIPFETFTQIIAADPTTPVRQNQVQKPGKFSKWLLDIYGQGNLRLEDLYRATEYLDLFMRHQKKLDVSMRNINNYKSLQDLALAIEPFKDVQTQSQVSAEAKKDAEKVFEDQQWLVVVPLTREASCYYGKGTEWCTAATADDYKHNMYDNYSRRGKLYININKQTQEKFQFHFQDNQFMDANDSGIYLLDFLDENPQLKEFYWNAEIKDTEEPTDIREAGDGSAEYLSYAADEFIDADFMEAESDKEMLKAIARGEGWEWFENYSYEFDPTYHADDVDQENANDIRAILTQDIHAQEYAWDQEKDWNSNEDVVRFALVHNDDVKSALDMAYSDVYSESAQSEAYEDIWNQVTTHFGLGKSSYEEIPHTYYTQDGEKRQTTKTATKWYIGPEDYKKMKFLVYHDDVGDDMVKALAYVAQGEDDHEGKIKTPYMGWQGDFEADHFNERLSERLAEHVPQTQAAAE